MNIEFQVGLTHSRKKLEVSKGLTANIAAVIRIEDGVANLTHSEVKRLQEALKLVQME